MIFLIFAADTQKCNKGSIKKASSFIDFSFSSVTNLEYQMIFAFEGKVCIPEKKSAGVRRKIHSHGCKVNIYVKSIFVCLLRPNEKMTMD